MSWLFIIIHTLCIIIRFLSGSQSPFYQKILFCSSGSFGGSYINGYEQGGSDKVEEIIKAHIFLFKSCRKIAFLTFSTLKDKNNPVCICRIAHSLIFFWSLQLNDDYDIMIFFFFFDLREVQTIVLIWSVIFQFQELPS